MDKAIVYFAKASITKSGSLNKKLGIVIRNFGMLENIKEKDSVALKLHFGELGNTRYIRPIWLRELAELIKSAKGMPDPSHPPWISRTWRVHKEYSDGVYYKRE